MTVPLGSLAARSVPRRPGREKRVTPADAQLKLELPSEPKDVGPLSLHGLLQVTGTLKDLKFRSPVKSLLARAAATAALYAFAPPAALLALLEMEPREDTECGKGKEGRKASAGRTGR